jgi:predicted transcriptional regulator
MGTDETSRGLEEADVLRLSVEIVASYLANNSISVSAIPDVIRSVHESLTNAGRPEPPTRPAEKQKPAVPVGRSVNQDYIVCLEDGKRLKMLKRYLRSRYNLTPDEYRRKWGLPPDYPMVAPAYASRRSEFAKQIGLGRGVRRQRAGGGASTGKASAKTARK